jgi:aspartyl-tRNA synthetase
VVPGCSHYSRKDLDVLTELARAAGAGNLATLCWTPEGLKGTAAKKLSQAEIERITAVTRAKEGDLACIIADSSAAAGGGLSALRLEFRDRLKLVPADLLAFGWIVDFPMFEWDADGKKWNFMHHPFTGPRAEHLAKLESDPGSVMSDAYDLVCNGYELASGSIRIHDREVQAKIFRSLGYGQEEIQAKFGHMLDAFDYGAPPHGGIAPGLDRMIMLMCDEPNIREVIAFPKTASGSDLMFDAPAELDPKHLRELHIKITE